MDEDCGHGSLRQLLWFVCTLLGGGKERSRESYRVLAVGGFRWTNYERKKGGRNLSTRRESYGSRGFW